MNRGRIILKIVQMILVFSIIFTPSFTGIPNYNLSDENGSELYPSWEDNHPPETPPMPNGDDYGETHERQIFCTSTNDPDGDRIRYGWDWNEDKIVDYWSPFYPPNMESCTDMYWDEAGTYNISVKAEDDKGSQSNFSLAKTIFINAPPYPPLQPIGPTSGFTKFEYSYSSRSFNWDNDSLWYKWIWGDSSSEWMGPYDSGKTAIATHNWSRKGTYQVRVFCKDVHNSITDWSEPINVTIKDAYDIKIQPVNIGGVNAYITNRYDQPLHNVQWNISINGTNEKYNILYTKNGTIEKITANGKDNTKRISTWDYDNRIKRRLGIADITIKISVLIKNKLIDKQMKKSGIIIGRLVIVL